ncbi:hypothetical protein R6Z07M_019745 [Ovis aries]
MELPCMLREEEQEPELRKSEGETKQVDDDDDDDDEVILVGVEHGNEDADVIFVGMTSTSKPVVSNILNRDTPGSYSRRKRYLEPQSGVITGHPFLVPILGRVNAEIRRQTTFSLVAS